MTPNRLLQYAIDPALSLLGTRYTSDGARALVLTIAMQETDLRHRVQQDGDADEYDDALGWWQFERIGVAEVLRHPASRTAARELCEALGYEPETEAVYRAIRDNDILAAGIARLALWRLPDELPTVVYQSGMAWEQYLAVWAPGEPNPEPWAAHYRQAWERVAWA